MKEQANIDFLLSLEEIIRSRTTARSPDSYVATLVARGDRRVAQKLGEEAVELALAVVGGDADEQLEEAADLVFHLLVLLQTQGLSLTDVARTLERRHEERSTKARRAE